MVLDMFYVNPGLRWDIHESVCSVTMELTFDGGAEDYYGSGNVMHVCSRVGCLTLLGSTASRRVGTEKGLLRT